MLKQRCDNSAGYRLKLATVAAFAGALVLSSTLAAEAQVAPAPRGLPPSVTSIGFGGPGNRAPGLPPSVTSPGFSTHRGTPARTFGPNREHPRRGIYPLGGAFYGVPYYPYSSYDDAAEPSDDASDPEYQGGPTIFDRRGSAMNHSTQVNDSASHRSKLEATSDPDPVSNQPDTVLVFKDGHQLEIANYAIVGSTLFDLTEGHRRKVALSELDLTATAKQNDERGIDFQIPLRVEAN
jgi:hypothetical protein